ncbi:unnamed protein product [Ectocarpus sp. CCAP 1310/34]|nr:unnamed protein product [Ectocarpus sp. CCAP 1310/34]
MVTAATTTKELSEEEIEDYKEAFSNFDKDGNGNIDELELGVVLRSLGYSPTNQQLKEMMAKVAMVTAATTTKELSEEEIEDYKEAFSNFDKDCSGNIDESELGVVMRSLGYSPTNEQLKEIMAKVDTDGNGGISFEEFVAMMQLGEVETDFKKEINEAFKFFDKDGDGEVTRAELAEIMRGLGDTLTDDEIDLLVKVADKDGDGVISIDE